MLLDYFLLLLQTTIAANGIVKNVTLSNINIAAGNFVGGIAGKCYGKIENCIVESGTVTGNARVGGIVGQLPSGTPSVKKCINKADVKSVMTSGDSFVGGIVGQSDQITRGTVIISQCGNEGEIYSPCNFVGGIIGRSVIKSEINQCYNKGKVTGASLVGGILGQSNALVLQNCYNSAEVIGTETETQNMDVGGILGNSTNTDMIIKNCYNVGTITKGYGLTKGGDNDGKNIPLINPIVFYNDENESESYDIAVYSVPNANSPLAFSNVVPEKGDVLKSCSWRMLGEEYVECNAIVNGLKEGNYYAADTDKQLKPGSSGSPVFLNGEVVGILCAGNYKNVNTPCNSELPLNLCVFLSSKVILELLEKNRFQ